jgi:hypothetical protein
VYPNFSRDLSCIFPKFMADHFAHIIYSYVEDSFDVYLASKDCADTVGLDTNSYEDLKILRKLKKLWFLQFFGDDNEWVCRFAIGKAVVMKRREDYMVGGILLPDAGNFGDEDIWIQSRRAIWFIVNTICENRMAIR